MTARRDPPLIVVTAAIIERDDRFLLTRRPEGKPLAGLWEFPGGKRDPGESLAECLAREICEELDAEVVVGREVFQIVHTYHDESDPAASRTVDLHFFECTLAGTPTPMHAQEMRWVPRAELASLEFPPADAELIERLTSARGSHGDVDRA